MGFVEFLAEPTANKFEVKSPNGDDAIYLRVKITNGANDVKFGDTYDGGIPPVLNFFWY